MKGNSNWNYRPYLPANRYSERGNPFICRLAPRETDCEAEWLGEGDSFTLCYSLRGQTGNMNYMWWITRADRAPSA